MKLRQKADEEGKIKLLIILNTHSIVKLIFETLEAVMEKYSRVFLPSCPRLIRLIMNSRGEKSTMRTVLCPSFKYSPLQ